MSKPRTVEPATLSGTEKVMVCDACLCASCWYGFYMCEKAHGAGTTVKTVADLRKLNREHESYWSDEVLMKIYGNADRRF